MAKKLSEAQAWREIARRMAQDPSIRYDYLCWHLDTDFDEWVVEASPETREAMIHRVNLHRLASIDVGATSSYFAAAWPDDECSRANVDIRVLAALFLALECESEVC